MKASIYISIYYIYLNNYFKLILTIKHLEDHYHLAVITTSSIFKIIRTTSVARVNALLVTKDGWRTFYYFISTMVPFLTLIPVYFSPLLCLFLSYVTTLMGFIPAFSANVNGIIYKASA
jgi:hypothetical protein